MASTLRLDKELDARLTALAAQTGRSKAYYIRAALAEKIDEMEALYLAEKRLENPGRIWSMSEVEQELGLDH
jgi:RHH-type rel operon transcriptional repressor/antitoxin RelB